MKGFSSAEHTIITSRVDEIPQTGSRYAVKNFLILLLWVINRRCNYLQLDAIKMNEIETKTGFYEKVK